MLSVLSIGKNEGFLPEIIKILPLHCYDSVTDRQKIINPLFMNKKYDWCIGPGDNLLGFSKIEINNLLDNMGKHADHLLFYRESDYTDTFWEERFLTRGFQHIYDMTNWIRRLPGLADIYKKIMVFKKKD
jgi:hypothetical protein